MDSMVSGDTTPIDITLTDDETGAAVDLATVASITYQMASSVAASAPYVSKSLSDGITVSGNVVTITLAPADTADLGGDYYHELELTFADGTVITPLRGTVSIERDLIQ